MKKRMTALVLSVCLVLSMLFTGALAAANNSYFYSQLSADGKEAYSYLLANNEAMHKGKKIEISKTDVSNPSGYLQSMNKAMLAFNFDHPEVFWVDSWSLGYSGYGTSYTFTYAANIDSTWNGGGRSISGDEAAVSASVSALASAAQSAGSSRYDQLLYVHDWLTQHNRYNSQAASVGAWSDSTPWEAISALDVNLSPVCEGYSRAFKLVCDALGVPCVLVAGDNHMWNAVQMDDGQWYGVDVTYDDPVYSLNGVVQNTLVSGGESHEYFLAGKTTMSKEHWQDNSWTYPTLNNANYDKSNANTGTDTTPEPVQTPAPTQTSAPTVAPTPTPTPTPEPTGLFPDVPQDETTAWYYDELADLVSKGIIGGTDAGTYNPSGTVSWGQAMKLILLATGIDVAQGAGSHWADNYIMEGIARGLLNVWVDPNEDITRNEVAELVVKVLGLTASGNGTLPFADVSESERSTAQAVYEAGIYNGVAEGGATYYRGSSLFRRDEIAVLFSRVSAYSESMI